jgi:PKD repeat protein
MFKMIDINGAGGESMADTWTCFGDASVQLRTPGTPDGPPPVNPEPPVAEFSADNTTIMATGSVQFTDQSTNNPTSWDWTFEGGTPATSTQKNPLITYNTPGVYDVTLTVTNSAGTDTLTKVDYITVIALQPPIADFSASSTSIAAGDSVTFTDQSSNNPTSWDWTFNGGTPSTSTEENPVITYNTPGTYTVTLTAANAAGSDTETKVDYINVSEKPYCASQGNTFSMEWIAGVEVGTMNNTSGAAGYTDFTSVTCDLTGGSTVNVTLTPGFSGSTYTEYWKIWIDYNGDNDFEDAGEEVFSGSGSTPVTGSFTVASGIDIVTRMRVSMKYASYPTPCETFTYGEVEDYTANIDRHLYRQQL